ncbi:hypothetical protein [Frigoribacterium sp. PhB118]|uniref:hypothetical protein n=1 Tax=Frigoribacterium sp. PhB118 TaxID=2485175 RepID=UPI0013152CB0|nr:hypothetical protein [Frigoribacterium sp. PhB118]
MAIVMKGMPVQELVRQAQFLGDKRADAAAVEVKTPTQADATKCATPHKERIVTWVASY